jgi:hypothetical protein
VNRVISTSIAALVGACTDVPLPYELEHTRVMAVRLEPPSLGPSERATIDVLVTDAIAGARVAAGAQLAVTSPAPITITFADGQWSVTAPSLLPSDTLVIPLDISISTDTDTLTAQKTLALGATGRNPIAPVILQDGVQAPAVMDPDRDVILDVDGALPDLSYRWFSSVGELTGYTRARATLEPEAGARGQLGVVVRDQAGGTAWTLVDAEVAP